MHTTASPLTRFSWRLSSIGMVLVKFQVRQRLLLGLLCNCCKGWKLGSRGMDSETTDITDDLNEFTDKAAKNEKNWRHDEEFIKTGFRKIKSLCLRNVCALRNAHHSVKIATIYSQKSFWENFVKSTDASMKYITL